MNDVASTHRRGGLVALLAIAAASIVGYDAIMAWTSVALSFPYFYAMIGSCLLYGAFGFFGARRFGFGRALLVGAWLGLVDASLGWLVSSAIGAGRIATGLPTLAVWLPTAALVTGVAMVCAGVGAGIGVVTQARTPTRD